MRAPVRAPLISIPSLAAFALLGMAAVILPCLWLRDRIRGLK